MALSLYTLVGITKLGEEESLKINEMTTGRKMLSYLAMNKTATALSLIRHVGLDEKEGRELLNRLRQRQLIRINKGEDE